MYQSLDFCFSKLEELSVLLQPTEASSWLVGARPSLSVAQARQVFIRAGLGQYPAYIRLDGSREPAGLYVVRPDGQHWPLFFLLARGVEQTREAPRLHLAEVLSSFTNYPSLDACLQEMERFSISLYPSTIMHSLVGSGPYSVPEVRQCLAASADQVRSKPVILLWRGAGHADGIYPMIGEKTYGPLCLFRLVEHE